MSEIVNALLALNRQYTCTCRPICTSFSLSSKLRSTYIFKYLVAWKFDTVNKSKTEGQELFYLFFSLEVKLYVGHVLYLLPKCSLRVGQPLYFAWASSTFLWYSPFDLLQIEIAGRRSTNVRVPGTDAFTIQKSRWHNNSTDSRKIHSEQWVILALGSSKKSYGKTQNKLFYWKD